MKKMLRFVLLLLPVLMVGVPSGFAADGVKELMIERAPAIRALKSAGVIGEKSDGFLGFVRESPADRMLVDAENADRKAAYAEIARTQGVSLHDVAVRRAARLFELALPGDWLQGADGTWYRKS
jgi:uncharacterized protein YdbL (DUF1318 family)